MELLGLIWAASLPHQNAVIRMSQSVTEFEANPSEEHVQGQWPPPNVNDAASKQQRFPLQLFMPQGFQPQFNWQPQPKMNWEKWAVTAKVTVVPQEPAIKNSSLKSGGEISNATISPAAAHCPAAGDHAPSLKSRNLETATQGYSIQVNNVTIGTLPSRVAADEVAAQIRSVITVIEENPSQLHPRLGDGFAAAKIQSKTAFQVPEDVASDEVSDRAVLATAWVNNLRQVFDGPALDLGKTQMVAQGLGETDQVIGGTASWYGPYFHGRLTATGEIFNQHDLTAAHKTLPFGTVLKVRNLLNDSTVVVRINDRGPYIGDRSLDLSYAAAQCLGSEIVGVIPYEATILEPGWPEDWRAEEQLTAQK
jgi:rare lipoprotein A (peptidoglycan hydrolase)